MKVEKAKQKTNAILFLAWMLLMGMVVGNALWSGVRSMWVDVVLFFLVFSPLLPRFLNKKLGSSLRVVSMDCPPFHEGDAGRFTVVVESALNRPVSDVQVVWKSLALDGDMETGNPIAFQFFCGGDHRGVYKWPEVNLSTSYPFKLFRTSRKHVVPGHYVVYPQIEQNAPAWTCKLPEETRMSRRGEEVISFRQYAVGDALSTVDWKISARQGELIVRQYEEPEAPSLVFSLENVKELELEDGLRRLCAWIVRADSLGLNYALALGHTYIQSGCGSQHRHNCLRALASFQQEEDV